ncbi:hypothetical protein L208DRAFT_1246563, partial [Tricholoma matsutake]
STYVSTSPPSTIPADTPAPVDEPQPSPPIECETKTISDPPVHPYSNILEAHFVPIVGDKTTVPSTTSKGKEPSY